MTLDPQLRGVFPVLVTPLGLDQSVDEDGLAREIAWIFGHGVAGVATGMVSEWLKLADRDRELLTELVCRYAGEAGKPAVVSCGAESTRGTVRAARRAEAVGAAGVMATPPLVANVGDEAILRHYLAIYDAVGLPVIIQDASGYVGRPLATEVQVRLFHEHPQRTYFKPEAAPVGPVISALQRQTEGAAPIFDGSGGLNLVDSFRRGITGTMPGPDVCWAVQRLWEALHAGDEDTTYRIGGQLSALIGLQATLDTFISTEKYLLQQQNVIDQVTRLEPVDPGLDQYAEQESLRLLARLRSAAESGANHER